LELGLGLELVFGLRFELSLRLVFGLGLAFLKDLCVNNEHQTLA